MTEPARTEGGLHGRSYRALTPEEWAAYCSGLAWTPSDAEKALLALSQVLLGDRHYGSPLPSDNARLLVEIAYEAAYRLCEAEGSRITSDAGPAPRNDERPGP